MREPLFSTVNCLADYFFENIEASKLKFERVNAKILSLHAKDIR